MDKTLHNKLTEKHLYRHTPAVAYSNGDALLTGLAHEMDILREAAKDLLQPRPQAVSRLLQMARDL